MKHNYWYIVILIFLASCKENSKHQAQQVYKNDVSDAIVTAIYPKQNILPENILKFYIQFSEPMREGNFLNHIKLHTSKGENVTGVFFDNMYELWNNNHTQITVLVDPGRVKTGLKQNIKQGRAFAVGETYTLTIGSTWKTISNKFLSKTYTKQFTIKEEDVVPPNMESILISKVEIGSKSPIIITSKEDMDAFQLKDYVRITINKTAIKGKFKLLDKGKTIQFTPNNPWKKDTNYQLQIDVRLEDIAANSFAGKFDRAVSDSKNFQQKGFLYKEIDLKQ